MHAIIHRREVGIRSVVLALVVLAAAFMAAAPANAYASPLIWVGSPIDGAWGIGGDPSTTPAGGHHRLVKASPQNDWAADLPGGGAAYLYVAPSDGAYNNAVTTRVTQIVDDNACRNGGGGDFVTVGVYYNGALYGHATYAHIDRDPSLYVGKTVARWGTYLGNVANLSGGATGGSSCWTGPHVHFEMRAQTQYACWNRGFSPGSGISRTNFMGFVSGPLTSYARACP